MAKRSDVKTETTPVTPEAIAALDDVVTLSPEEGERLLNYGKAVDPYNVRAFGVGESALCVYGGSSTVDVEGRPAVLGLFKDLQTGSPFRIWLPDYLLQEFLSIGLTVGKSVILLTYRGRVPSKHRGRNACHAWARYYYTDEEFEQLRSGKSLSK